MEVIMKLLFILMFSFTWFASSLQQPDKGLNIEYDKFRDITVAKIRDVAAENVKGAKTVTINPGYAYKGETASQFVDGTLTITITGDPANGSEKWLELRLLIDGKTTGPYYASRTDSMETAAGQMYFYTVINGSSRIIEAIAKASKVEGQIGTSEFGLSHTTISQIKALYDRMPKKPSGLTIKYNPSEDLTLVHIADQDATAVKNAKYLVFNPFYAFDGKIQTSAVSQRIMLTFATDRPIDKDNPPKLTVRVDGKSVGQFQTEYVKTLVFYKADNHQFGLSDDAPAAIEAIARGSKVTGAFGEIEFTLSPETISQIKLLYEKIHQK
jgi:hypothetical protein